MTKIANVNRVEEVSPSCTVPVEIKISIPRSVEIFQVEDRKIVHVFSLRSQNFEYWKPFLTRLCYQFLIKILCERATP